MRNVDYSPAYEAGRKQAANWIAQHGYSLAVYRDQRRAEYVIGLAGAPNCPEVCTGFDAGFAAGVADMITGVSHG